MSVKYDQHEAYVIMLVKKIFLDFSSHHAIVKFHLLLKKRRKKKDAVRHTLLFSLFAPRLNEERNAKKNSTK